VLFSWAWKVPLIFIEDFIICAISTNSLFFELFTALFSGLYSVMQRHLAVMF
jgi:hypothetical protein